MGSMMIDGRRVEFTDEPNVLAVIRKAGIDIPTLCYHSELSIYGACRLCTVENEWGKTFASCSEKPKDGMVIYTNTPRLIKYRKQIIELLLASHCRDCTTCIKSGECHLQDLAHRLGVHDVRFENTKEPHPIDDSSPAIVRDPNKCILCGDCVRMCDNVQGVNAIDFAYRGTEAIVSPAFNKPIAQTDCVNCGQCRVVCPTGAISIKTNIDVVWDALADKDTIVIAQIAPAVRVAAGEEFGIPKGENVMGKLVGVLHRLGFDEVYDTAYGADLTVMEESKEFMERFNAGENLPLFTSCCPAWVKFCENRYPEFVPHLSSCRSPQQMFGAVVREYYKNPENNAGKKLVSATLNLYDKFSNTEKKNSVLHLDYCSKNDWDEATVTTNDITVRGENTPLSSLGLQVSPAYNVDYKEISFDVTDVIKEKCTDNLITFTLWTGTGREQVIASKEYSGTDAQGPTLVLEFEGEEPTPTPTVVPTATPILKPTPTPTVVPTATPTLKPTATPAVTSTLKPTTIPTAIPTVIPTTTPNLANNKITAMINSNNKLDVTLDFENVDMNDVNVYVAFKNNGKLVGMKMPQASELKGIDLIDKEYTDIEVYAWDNKQKPYANIVRIVNNVQ